MMRSPFKSVRSLLSSSSVFMDSIQSVSTGPSNSVHFCVGDSSMQMSRITRDKMPSVHSCVPGSKHP